MKKLFFIIILIIILILFICYTKQNGVTDTIQKGATWVESTNKVVASMQIDAIDDTVELDVELTSVDDCSILYAVSGVKAIHHDFCLPNDRFLTGVTDAYQNDSIGWITLDSSKALLTTTCSEYCNRVKIAIHDFVFDKMTTRWSNLFYMNYQMTTLDLLKAQNIVKIKNIEAEIAKNNAK